MPRKKAFSGKQKRQQLKERREKKLETPSWQKSSNSENKLNIKKINQQPRESDAKDYNSNRYRLHFLKETRDEIERRKLLAQTTVITKVPEDDTEVDIQDVYQHGSELDMPKRPHWDYKTSKVALEEHEKEYFQEYLKQIYEKFNDKSLSYFEHNLETWRQLWRVLEMSDVICLVTDVRHPVLHFSPALYEHVVKTLQKPLILILNKIDLVPAPLVAAWHQYFSDLFQDIKIVCFTSFPKDLRSQDITKRITKRRPAGKRVYTTQIGPNELLEICREICGDKVNLEQWEKKIENDLANIGIDSPHHTVQGAEHHSKENSNFVPFKNGILTLGFVGHPNVGKSSLMNGLIGKKVVSTSVTPGHTKYFQTYFLVKNVMLCDCPGLTFPSLVDKQFQILSGIYPISQVQEPYTSVGYLAERLPLVSLLQLTHPDNDGEKDKFDKWTPWDICEAWAIKRGFFTAKKARPDAYRAANNILRWAVDGKIRLCMRPPGYTKTKDKWMDHPVTLQLIKLRGSEDVKSMGDNVKVEVLHPFNMKVFENVEELYSTATESEDSQIDENTDSEDEISEEDKPISTGTSLNPFTLLGSDEDK